MTKCKKAGMESFVAFAIILFVCFWFVTPVEAAASANNLNILNQPVSYADKDVRQAAIKAFARHMWYLNEVLV